MNVSMWMTRDVLTIRPDMPIARAAMIMASHRFRHLLVTENHPQGDKLLGIISATDIYRVFPADVNPFAIAAPELASVKAIAADIMTRRLHTIMPLAPIEEAARTMQEHKIGALPVVQGTGLAGMITQSDIMRAFVCVFDCETEGARITFDLSGGEDVFNLMSQEVLQREVRVVSLLTLEHPGRAVCVVRVVGAGVDGFLEDLWNSGHRVINVLRTGACQSKHDGSVIAQDLSDSNRKGVRRKWPGQETRG